MRLIVLSVVCAIGAWLALGGVVRAQVTDPLAAMNGRWTSTDSGDCATKWFEYSVSADRREYTTRYPDGKTQVNTILHTEPNKVYLFYRGETRLTPQGDPILWWLIFDAAEALSDASHRLESRSPDGWFMAQMRLIHVKMS